MIETRKIYPHIIFLVVGMAVALPLLISPVSDHWDISVSYISSKMSLQEIFSNFYWYSADTYIFRPFAFLLFGVFYNLFGLNNVLYYLLKSVFAALFGSVSYLLLCKLTNNKKLSFFSSLFSVLMPSAVISINKLPEIEVIGVVFLLAAFLEYLNLERFKKLNKNATAHVLLFLALSITGILFKETIRLYVLLFPFLYLLIYKKISKVQKISLAILAVTALYFSLGFLPMSTSLTDKMPLTLNHTWFVFGFVLSQLTYPFLIGGSIILFLFSLKKYLKLSANWLFLAGVLLLIFSLTMPLTVPFFWLGTLFFSYGPMNYILFFSLILLISLVMIIFNEKGYVRFFSLTIMTVFLSILGYIFFFPDSRQIISIRAFIAVSPFLLYLIFHSLSQMTGRIKIRKNRIASYLSVLMVIIFILFSYHLIASSIDLSYEKMGFNKANYEGIKYLSNASLNGTVVFYTNEIFWLDKMDMEVINPKMDASQNFSVFFLNSNKLSNKTDDIRKELCLKTQGYAGDVYIFSAKPYPMIDVSTFRMLEGDYNWIAEDTFDWLKPLPSTSQYFFWPTGYSAIESYQKTVYSPETLLETYLEKNADLLFEYNESFLQFPVFLEDIMYRYLNRVPIEIDYKYMNKIYYLNTTKLNCDNWYPWETSLDGVKYRFMSQDAVTTVVSNATYPEKAKLKLTGWSFYKPRELDVYFNGKFIMKYNFSEPMAARELVTPTVDMKPGENTLLLHSKEGCDISGDVLKEYKDDKRCLSFAFSDVSVIMLKDLAGKIMYENNWYEPNNENNMSFRGMSQNATLFFFNPNNYTEKIRLNFIADTYGKPRTLQLYQDGVIIAQYLIPNGTRLETPIINIKPGENTILFHSKEGCEMSKIMNLTSCISLVIGNMEKLSVENEITYDEKSSYKVRINDTDYLAFSSNMAAFVFNSKDTEQNVTLNFSVWSLSKPRNLTIYLNGKDFGSYEISSLSDVWINRNISLSLNLMPGNNTLMFVSGSKCTPSYNPEVNFSGCLSFALREIGYVEEKKNISFSYEDNWYLLERLGNLSWRWMSQNASLLVFNLDDSKNTTLNFSVQSFYKNRTLDIYLNGRYINSYNIPPDRKENIQINRQLNLGKNILTFNSREGCEAPKSLGTSSDERCLSFALTDITAE